MGVTGYPYDDYDGSDESFEKLIESDWAGAGFNRRNEESAAAKVCIGCEQAKGKPHLSWCPVVTGTLNSLPGIGDQ